MSKTAVLFDMDGVLVKSEEVWFRVVEEAGRKFAGRAVSRDEFFPTFGQGTAADIPSFGLRCTVAELDAFYVERFTQHLEAMWINPEAEPLLRTLREREIGLALVTNTVSPLAARILDTAKLGQFFSVRATADRVAKPKPAPDMVLLACRELGVAVEQACMVGDSKYDRQAAQAASVTFVGLGLPGEYHLETLSGFLSVTRHLFGGN